MQGLHLTADLHDCRCERRWLLDAKLLGDFCVQSVQGVGLQPVAQLFYTFPDAGGAPSGVTATVLLAESHLCVHTWPEQLAVTVDVYVCNFGADHSAKAHALMAALLALFDPAWVQRNSLARGGGAAVADAGAPQHTQVQAALCPSAKASSKIE